MKRTKIIVAVVVGLLLILTSYIAFQKDIGGLFESEPQLEENETTNNPVSSPDGNHSAVLRTEGGVPKVFIDDEKKPIDKNIFHMQWLNNDILIYSKSVDGISEIIKYNIATNEKVTLIHKESELMGFEILNNIILCTSTIDVGFIRIEDNSHEMLLTFNQPIRGSDEPYVPNIIPSEDRTAATVEILDENYLDTQKIRYLVIDNLGRILSDQII